MPDNPRSPRSADSPRVADPNLIHPGDIVWLDSTHLTPTRGRDPHTWPHDAICLYWYRQDQILPKPIVSGTIFQFVCISSITARRPLDHATQVRLDHTDENLGLAHPSAACVDFAPSVTVSIEGDRHVLHGVERRPNRRVKDERVLGFIISLFNQYWTSQSM
jgi:hypothetical protein